MATSRFLGIPEGADAATALRQRIAVNEWLFWQMAGLGPMTGQYGHFHVYAPDDIAYAKERYRKETGRLYGVLDRQLARHEWLAGAEYSIADMASYPWAVPHEKQGIDLADYPQVARWYAAMAARPAVQRAYARAEGVNPRVSTVDDEAKKHLFGQERR